MAFQNAEDCNVCNSDWALSASAGPSARASTSPCRFRTTAMTRWVPLKPQALGKATSRSLLSWALNASRWSVTRYSLGATNASENATAASNHAPM